MRVHILSDLHLEFHKDYGESFLQSLPNVNADYCIFAGDICLLRSLDKHKLPLMKWASRYKQVFWVMGNHEYYYTNFKEAHKLLQDFANIKMYVRGLEVLEEGFKIALATLWFVKDDLSDRYKDKVSDFHVIDNFDPSVYGEHTLDHIFLENVIDNETIVVTHHLPLMQSVRKEFKDSPLNKFYYGRGDFLLDSCKPLAWVHGHTHNSCNYVYKNTRVICNPYGYAGHEVNLNFKPDFVLEV